jgi:MscS family membrane protein
MNDFLDKVILDNTVRTYLIVLGVILFVFIFKRYLSKYVAGLLFRLVNSIFRGVDKTSFVNLIVHPLGLFLFAFVTIAALDKLKFPTNLKFDIYEAPLHKIFETCSKILLLSLFTWMLLRVIDFIALILHRRADRTLDQTDNQLIGFLKDFLKAIVSIVGFLMILKFAFHFEISSLVTGLSIATAAVALATKESLENLIASFIIFSDRPFRIGDLVKVQQVIGTVEKIGLRSTRIRTTDKTFVTVPNKQMVDSVLDNLSLRTHRRGLLNLELHPQTSRELVNQFLSSLGSLIKQNKQVDTSTILLTDINKDAIIVQAEYFVLAGTQETFNGVKQDLNLGVIALINQLGIRMAKGIEVVVTQADQ